MLTYVGITPLHKYDIIGGGLFLATSLLWGEGMISSPRYPRAHLPVTLGLLSPYTRAPLPFIPGSLAPLPSGLSPPMI